MSKRQQKSLCERHRAGLAAHFAKEVAIGFVAVSEAIVINDDQCTVGHTMDIDHILRTAFLLLDGGFHRIREKLRDVAGERFHLHPTAVAVEIDDDVGVEVGAVGELAGAGVILGDADDLRLGEEGADGLRGLSGQLLLGKTCQDSENAEDGGDDIFHNKGIYNNCAAKLHKILEVW